MCWFHIASFLSKSYKLTDAAVNGTTIANRFCGMNFLYILVVGNYEYNKGARRFHPHHNDSIKFELHIKLKILIKL